MPLRHVYWIGGGSGSGKTTVARRLAAAYGLRLYSSDDVMADHGTRTTPEESPALAAFIDMDMDERWVKRRPRTMLDSFHWFRGEGFRLIVEDLHALRTEPPVIAEGFRLLPDLVMPLLDVPDHAVWLLPTPEFRRRAFESRDSLWTIAGKTTDPERALTNLLERDRMFTDRLYRDTKRLGLRAIDVDMSMTEAELSEQVARAFGL